MTESSSHLQLRSLFSRVALGSTCVVILGMSLAAHGATPEGSKAAPTLLDQRKKTLNSKTGVTGAMSGGGAAHVNDISSIDSNPAGIALARELALATELGWRAEKTQTVEVGVTDSVMSEIAAGIKARQLTQTGSQNRRFTLGLAEHLPDTPLVIGIAGDYFQMENDIPVNPEIVDSPLEKKKEERYRMRAGAVGLISPGLQIAVKSDGYFDDTTTLQHGVGLSLGFTQHYLLSGDVLFTKEGVTDYLGGVSVFAKEFLDLYLSYGYELGSKMHRAGGGFAVKSPKFRLFYSASKELVPEAIFYHTLGATLTFRM